MKLCGARLEREDLASLFRAVIPLLKLGFRGGLPQLAGFCSSHVEVLPPPPGGVPVPFLFSIPTKLNLSLPFVWPPPLPKPFPTSNPTHLIVPPLFSYQSLHPLPLRPSTTNVTTTKPTQIHHSQNVGLVSYPPIRYLFSGDLLCSNRFMRLTDRPGLRPPAKPPPIGEFVVKEAVLSSNPQNLSPLVARSSSSALAPIRPPPKSPWTCYCESRMSLASSVLSDPGCVLLLVVYCFPKSVAILFVKMPQRASGLRNSLFCGNWHRFARIEV